MKDVLGIILATIVFCLPVIAFVLLLTLLESIYPSLPDLIGLVIIFSFHSTIVYQIIKGISSVKNRGVLVFLTLIAMIAILAAGFALFFLPNIWEWFVKVSIVAKFLIIVSLSLIVAIILLIKSKEATKRLKDELDSVRMERNELYRQTLEPKPKDEILQKLKSAEEIRYLKSKIKELESELHSTRNIASNAKHKYTYSIDKLVSNNSFKTLLKNTPLYKEMVNCDTDYRDKRINSAITENMVIRSISGFEDITCIMDTHINKDKHTYRTSFRGCSCPDYQIHHIPCKHMYRLAIECGQLLVMAEEVKNKKLNQ